MEEAAVASLPRAWVRVFAQLLVEVGERELAKERASAELPLGSW